MDENRNQDQETEAPSAETGTVDPPARLRTVLIGIKGRNRTAHFSAGEHTLRTGDDVVINTEQGKALGRVLEPPVELECRGCHKVEVLRKATPEELVRDQENRELEKKAFEFCNRTIAEWELPMHLFKVEYLLDRTKATFYFTAEKRVDFRELVRTLAREFGLRIEMRQIGIRDEARLLGGIGPCGLEFCCSTFLQEFAPISVKMAKDQNVILNPSKISGGCGRLLCCLNYEFEMYRDLAEGLPKVGKKVTIPEGSGKVRSYDLFTRSVTLDMTEGPALTMDIDEFRGKLQ